MSKRSVSLERRVQAYLKPGNDRLFNAYVKSNAMKESEAVNVIVRDFFSKMPEQDKQRILRQADNKD